MFAFLETGAAGLTMLFLFVVAALASSLVCLFCALEQSQEMIRFRAAVIQRVDGRFSAQSRDHRND